MKLDNNLRLSYKFNQHDQLSFGKKTKSKADSLLNQQKMCRKCV